LHAQVTSSIGACCTSQIGACTSQIAPLRPPASFIWARVCFDSGTDYLKLASLFSPPASTPALLRFLAPQSSIAWLDPPPVSIQDGRGGWGSMGDVSISNGPPSLAGGLVGIWNRIPRSCGSVSTQGWKEEQCWWRSKQPRQHQS